MHSESVVSLRDVVEGEQPMYGRFQLMALVPILLSRCANESCLAVQHDLSARRSH